MPAGEGAGVGKGCWDGLLRPSVTPSPVNAALALQVLHARGRVPYHLQQCFHPQACSLRPKEGQEVAPWEWAVLVGGSRWERPSPAECLTPRGQPPLLTLHKLHDDVDGLFLGADANETNDVGVAVLLQDPEGLGVLLRPRARVGGVLHIRLPSPRSPREGQVAQGRIGDRQQGTRAADQAV